jgi:hypothetical protein
MHALTELICGSRDNLFIYGTWSWHSEEIIRRSEFNYDKDVVEIKVQL